MNELLEPQSTLIMKELSDIKEKLATNTAETSNVKSTVNEIKSEIRTIQQSFVTHEEFKIVTDITKDHESRVRSLEKNVWKAIGALAVLQVLIPIIIKYLHL